MDQEERFAQSVPDSFYLQPDIEKLNQFLSDQGFLSEGETIEKIEKPGEGNMNYVLRVQTTERSFILKQSRPWVEKYPQIEAPISRISVEYQYLEHTTKLPDMKRSSLECQWYSQEHYLMVLEDLGDASDLTSLYQRDVAITDSELRDLVSYLSILHHAPFPGDFPDNRSMRELNHEHIFEFPFDASNGLDLDSITPGLQKAARTYQRDVTLKQIISSLGLIYLSPGKTLIHGDFYPGSWLQSSGGVKVIDPEFSFVGVPEFDIGVFFAHMLMSQQSGKIMQELWNGYRIPPGFHERLASGFAGVEILRRIIGIAQLPLDLSLHEKKSIMKTAASYISKGDLIAGIEK